MYIDNISKIIITELITFTSLVSTNSKSDTIYVISGLIKKKNLINLYLNYNY